MRGESPGPVVAHIPAHDFFSGEDFMLRATTGARMIADYATACGLRSPAGRRAHARGPDRSPFPEVLLVSTDVGGIRHQ